MGENQPIAPLKSKTGDKMENQLKDKVYLVLTGALTGLANGFFGGGGGMIVVPLMIYLLKMKTKSAHVTALAVILPITLISALVYFIGGKFDFKIGLPSLLGVVLGGILGAWLLGKISAKWLTKIFSLVMLIAGVKAFLL
jgi:uncharacterized membrane protein YfcA